MSEKEKQIAQEILNAMNHIPDDKKEFFVGYAQGVADAVKKQRKTTDPQESPR